jgi:hypothetical protein
VKFPLAAKGGTVADPIVILSDPSDEEPSINQAKKRKRRGYAIITKRRLGVKD